ncbi:MAG: hypothetical protein ACI9W2_002336 [Gammaproteobacteria bacterium]|jgi:hypothetical protein
MGFSIRETIGQSKSQVWETVTDWTRAHQWMGGVSAVRMRDTGEAGLGSVLAFDVRGTERERTITRWTPGDAFALRASRGNVTVVYIYRFEDSPQGTQVRLDIECLGHGLGWRVLAPVVSAFAGRSNAGQLRALKKLVEGG